MSDDKIIAAPETSGEHIRDENVFTTLGGSEPGYQWVTLDFKKDEKADIKKETSNELQSLGEKSPFGLLIQIQIKEDLASFFSDSKTAQKEDLEAVVEKKVGDFFNLISGVSHEHTRDQIEIKISKDAVTNGLTFEKIKIFLREQITEEFSFIKEVWIQIQTDIKAVNDGLKKARRAYKKRDERSLLMHDESVDCFYGCKICQISSPAHVCVITPDHPSVCGTINWFEAAASCLANPDGPIFEIQKGDLLDERGGEYDGVNQAVLKNSGFENEKIQLYSLLDNPHTTGSVFEIIAFWIPELEGIGLIDRASKIPSVNCLTFEEMMIFTGYGQQISGFSGVGETYLLSEKFFQKEGGLKNVIWMSSALKNRFVQKLEDGNEKKEELLKRLKQIPTENEARNLKELEKWKNGN